MCRSTIYTTTLFLLVMSQLLGSCTSTTPQLETVKYPRKPAENPERKTGPAMLLYEAAEEDADPNKVIVIPPSDEKTETSD